MALGLAGLIAGVSAWFRPVPEPRAAAYSEQEVAAATKAVCEAYSQFNKVLAATSKRNLGNDATAKLVVAVNVRLGLYAGGDYLIQSIQASPAASADLRQRVTEIAATYQEIAMKQLAEVAVTDLDPLAERAKAVGKEIDKDCQ